MLKSRVLTAAVLAPLFVLGVLFLPNYLFTILVGVVAAMGAWEWAHLSGYRAPSANALTVAAVVLLMIAAYPLRDSIGGPVFIVASVAWLITGLMLVQRRHEALMEWPRPLRLVSGVGVLVTTWLAITVVQQSLPAAALLLFALIWAADTGAYFAGRRWGRRRLALAISPGKTLEGVAGAVVAALAAVSVFAWGLGLGVPGWLALGACSVIVVLLSVLGDLFESNLKRLESVKDSGGLLPGHGGVLDRIDSMTAAAPFFALSWLWWFESATA